MCCGFGQVDFRTILGAISVFTLLGLLFAFLYVAFSRWNDDGVLHRGRPRALERLPVLQLHHAHDDRLWELVPATVGQSFAVVEMLVGQIFLVTLVAGLVSLWRPGGKTAADGTDA